MHRQDFFLRIKVVEEGEDRFLNLSGITGPADQDQFFAEIDDDIDL